MIERRVTLYGSVIEMQKHVVDQNVTCIQAYSNVRIDQKWVFFFARRWWRFGPHVTTDVSCWDLIKGWTWIPDNLSNLYSCWRGLSYLWTKSSVFADKPDASLFETSTLSFQRCNRDAFRVYVDFQVGRKRSEVANTETQSWVLIHSKGLLHSDIQDMYQKGHSSYVEIIPNEKETERPQDVEYSLWTLHYKRIDESHKRIHQSSASWESKKPTMP